MRLYFVISECKSLGWDIIFIWPLPYVRWAWRVLNLLQTLSGSSSGHGNRRAVLSHNSWWLSDSSAASPISCNCHEGQSERTFPILAFSSQFFLFFSIFPIFLLLFPLFPLLSPIFDIFLAASRAPLASILSTLLLSGVSVFSSDLSLYVLGFACQRLGFNGWTH